MFPYKFFKQVFLARKLQFTKGQIKLFEQPMLFIPMEYVVEITKNIFSNGKDYMLERYLEAWKAGVIFMNTLAEKYRMKSFDERYKIAMEIIAMAGFGDYETVKFQKHLSYFKIINNPIAEYFKKSKIPVDVILRGFNAGGGTPVHEMIINTIETHCKAVTGRHCIHINANTETLKKYKDQKLVSEQLDLNWLLPRQKKILNELNINISE